MFNPRHRKPCWSWLALPKDEASSRLIGLRAFTPRRLASAVAVVALCIGALVTLAGAAGPARASQPKLLPGPQRTWAPIGRPPLPDRVAASLITRAPEMRPANARANAYVPTNAELKQFRNAQYSATGKTAVQENHWLGYVTGRPGLRHPSTDDLIQWTAHKWGIPEDDLRALVIFESWERQNRNGDLTQVPASWMKAYPQQAKSSGHNIWLSMGIAQIKWLPNGSVNVGTQRLRWESTAFNLDYLGATIRFYYDGDCRWCTGSYHAGDQWGSIGAWNSSKPWYNAEQLGYINYVKAALQRREWTEPRS